MRQVTPLKYRNRKDCKRNATDIPFCGQEGTIRKWSCFLLRCYFSRGESNLAFLGNGMKLVVSSQRPLQNWRLASEYSIYTYGRGNFPRKFPLDIASKRVYNADNFIASNWIRKAMIRRSSIKGNRQKAAGGWEARGKLYVNTSLSCAPKDGIPVGCDGPATVNLLEYKWFRLSERKDNGIIVLKKAGNVNCL